METSISSSMEEAPQSKSNSNSNVVTHTSPFPIFAMAVSPHHLAVGSFLEDANNTLHLLSTPTLTQALSIPHPYPPTKLLFHPHHHHHPHLLAASSDLLRLYDLRSAAPDPRSVLNNSRASEFCAPLTSFDWNDAEPRRIGTASVDTTCTVWDVERGTVETQLIAHDREVLDIAWGEAGVFASVSADASVRMFDLRDKEHSTIVYESPDGAPLLRLAWNRRDLRYMAAVAMDCDKVVVLDIRSPAAPVAELRRHRGDVNGVAWAPQSRGHLCSVGDDGRALIWDVAAAATAAPAPAEGVDPVLVYTAEAEINQVKWSAAQPEWVAVAFGNKAQLLRV